MTPSMNYNIKRLRSRSKTWLLRNVVMPLGDRVYGQKMMQRLRFLEKAQWWDRDRIYDHRNSLLKELIKTAYEEVPFYRDLMEKSHVKPEDIQSPEDLYKIPVIDKDTIRPAYPDLITRKTRRKAYEVHTSGSTGKNFCLTQTFELAGWYRATFILTLGWAGWKMGEKHLQTGMTLDRKQGRRLKDKILNCHYISAFNISDPYLDSNLELIEKYKIRHVWGYPGSLYFLARRAIQKGWNQPLCSVVTWGDNLFQKYRDTIEQAFKTSVTDTYGCAEGAQIAGQCGTDQNYHIYNFDVILEFLDSENRPVPNDQPGNLIFTRLNAGPMPMIRYKVGDIGVRGNKTTCPCGRGFDVMKSIDGRDTDVVITPEGNRLIVHYFTGILEHFPEIDSFQIVQENIESITLRLLPTTNLSALEIDRITDALAKKGAQDLKINVEVVDEIPLSAGGKRRFVISKLGKSFHD